MQPFEGKKISGNLGETTAPGAKRKASIIAS